MSEPLACAICLTKDRPKMLRRAVQSFRAQTYSNKWLIVVDSGGNAGVERLSLGPVEIYTHLEPATIGKLRNVAVELARNADILIHFDDDDWSHPNRIAEQVAHLQRSGADVVGYNELLFWRTGKPQPYLDLSSANNGEAWIYRNVHSGRPGTSFCYWRKTWERKPFPDAPKKNERGEYGTGEDYDWISGLGYEAVSSLEADKEPQLIASIHGGNTLSYDIEGMIARGSWTNWMRVPLFDEYCREMMQ